MVVKRIDVPGSLDAASVDILRGEILNAYMDGGLDDIPSSEYVHQHYSSPPRYPTPQELSHALSGPPVFAAFSLPKSRSDSA